MPPDSASACQCHSRRPISPVPLVLDPGVVVRHEQWREPDAIRMGCVAESLPQLVRLEARLRELDIDHLAPALCALEWTGRRWISGVDEPNTGQRCVVAAENLLGRHERVS